MFRGKQGFPWMIGPETRKETTMWYWYLLVSVLSLFIGIGVTAYLKRDNRGFEILMKGLHVVAFYRCFGKWSEAAVSHELLARKKALLEAFQQRDLTRDYVNMLLPSKPSYESWVETLSYWEGDLAQRQQEYDYAVGLALLSGFGKVTSKVSTGKVTAAA
jgi:hypothetical protein